jgi:hypothetical protein
MRKSKNSKQKRNLKSNRTRSMLGTSDLSNDTNKHNRKSRETIPLNHKFDTTCKNWQKLYLLRDNVTRFSTSVFFHQTIPSRSLIYALKYFLISLRICQVNEYLLFRNTRHSAVLWSSTMPHSAGLFSQNMYEDECVCSCAMSHSVGQIFIAMDKLVKLWTRAVYDLKVQSIKKSFIGDFPYVIPIK